MPDTNNTPAASDDYRTTDTCDGCRKRSDGTMMHAPDGMGLPTPVLFLCDPCRRPKRR